MQWILVSTRATSPSWHLKKESNNKDLRCSAHFVGLLYQVRKYLDDHKMELHIDFSLFPAAILWSSRFLQIRFSRPTRLVPSKQHHLQAPTAFISLRKSNVHLVHVCNIMIKKKVWFVSQYPNAIFFSLIILVSPEDPTAFRHLRWARWSNSTRGCQWRTL